ncbi:MAG: hypothetical protein GXP08_03740 [Gammaproteobacteria bacterium]|nr:hypothetical protein [Gammaproteobacteria bacterium]
MGKVFQVEQIAHYIQHAARQIDQIERRVLKKEVIPHSEKVFSIFEEHTEWVSTKSRCHETEEKRESL